MAAINVQSAAAARVLEHRPDAARDALEAIQQASAQVLDELGAMLTVLRDPGEDADLAPSPGVRDLEKLIEGARHAELDVRLEKRGTVEDIPPAVGTAVFRVVQEALTNAIRYAAGALTSVRIEHDAGRTVAEITSQPAAIGSQTAAVTRSGVGLIGLRERVQAVGGSFVAEATESGAFVVRATWIS
jgi:signal transduction histidine kinase